MRLISKIIKPKKLNISDYPSFIANELTAQLWIGVLSLIVMLVLGIVYKKIGLALLGIIFFGMSALPSLHSYYVLTRDLCYFLDGVCTEIKNSKNAQDVTQKLLYFSKNKTDFVVESSDNGQTYIIPEKKKLLGGTIKCKPGERMYAIFMPNASHQNLNGDFVIYPLFVFTQKDMNKLNKELSEEK